jgi:hypothetical protein
MRPSILLRPFDLLARRMDRGYRTLTEGLAGRKLAPIAIAEYLGWFALGVSSRLWNIVWVWIVPFLGWLLGGLVDPCLWRRVYGRSAGRKASLIANLDVLYLFALGWLLASLSAWQGPAVP